MIIHGLIVLIIFWAIFSRTHRIKADVSTMKQKNDQDHDILAREVLRHREMILRQEEENRKINEKVDREISKMEKKIRLLEDKIDQANEDINYFASQIENLKTYSEYLEEQRSKSPEGSGEWHKWNNKMLTNDGKIYTFQTRMNKAQSAKREAEIEMEVA